MHRKVVRDTVLNDSQEKLSSGQQLRQLEALVKMALLRKHVIRPYSLHVLQGGCRLATFSRAVTAELSRSICCAAVTAGVIESEIRKNNKCDFQRYHGPESAYHSIADAIQKRMDVPAKVPVLSNQFSVYCTSVCMNERQLALHLHHKR